MPSPRECHTTVPFVFMMEEDVHAPRSLPVKKPLDASVLQSFVLRERMPAFKSSTLALPGASVH